MRIIQVQPGMALSPELMQAQARGEVKIVSTAADYAAATRAASQPSGGGSAPALTGSIQQAIGQARMDQNKANKANEQRYQEGLSTLHGGYDNAMNLLQGAGTAAHTRIGQQEQAGIGNALQTSVSRGLTNTTIQDSLQRGVHRDAEQARQSVDEAVAGQKAGVEQNKANSIAGFIERRNDNGPDLSLLSTLMRGAAGDTSGAMRTGSVIHQPSPLSPTLPSPSISLPQQPQDNYYVKGADPAASIASSIPTGGGPGPIGQAVRLNGNKIENVQSGGFNIMQYLRSLMGGSR
jgi:hypothetical protein